MRMIFSTVRAPQEPALTVESLAMIATGRPCTRPMPVTTPSAGQIGGARVGEEAVLDEVLAAVIAEERDPLAAEELAGGGVRLVVLGRAALLDLGAQRLEFVAA